MQYKDLQLDKITLNMLFVYSMSLFVERVNERLATSDLAAFRELITRTAGEIAAKIIQNKTNVVNNDFFIDKSINRELMEVFSECMDDVITEVVTAPAKKCLTNKLLTGDYWEPKE